MDAATLEWNGICAVMAGSLRRHGTFRWDEIRSAVGARTYGAMQWVRQGEQVWVVDRDDVRPASRRSAIDCARVARPTLHTRGPWHALVGDPHEVGADSADVPWGKSCAVAGGDLTMRRLHHLVGGKTLATAHAGLVHGIVGSFYEAIATRVEGEILEAVASAPCTDLAAARHATGNAARKGASARMIEDAAASILQENPGVPFPHGMVCLVPQLIVGGLFGAWEEWARRGTFCGMDVVATPAQGRAPPVAVVAAKTAISVALTSMELVAISDNGDTRIVASCGAGVSIDSKMAASVPCEVSLAQ